MNRFLAFSLAVLITPVVAKADFVLDDFSTVQLNNTTQNSPIGGTSASSRVTVSSGIAGGSGSMFSVFGDAGTITYNFATAFNPGENFIVFRNVQTTVAGRLEVFFRNNSPHNNPGPTPISSVGRNLGMVGTPTDIMIDITSISDIQNTDQVLLSFVSPGAGSVGFSQVDFTSAPEPASLALAGFAISSLGGMRYARRRRKAADIVA